MALPNDVTTCTLSFGPYLDAAGKPLFSGMTGTITPSWSVNHVSTGAVIAAAPAEIRISSQGTASIVLPHTDQLDLTPSNFTYTCHWTRSRHPSTPGNKTFALPAAAGSTVDFDLLAPAEEVRGVSVPVVASSQALIGLDTDGVPFFDPDGVGVPASIALDADGTPYITAVGSISSPQALPGSTNLVTQAQLAFDLSNKVNATDPRLTDARPAAVYTSTGTLSATKRLRIQLTADETDVNDLSIDTVTS